MYKRIPCVLALVLAASAAWAAPPSPPSAADQAKLQKEFEQLQQQMQQLGERMGELAEKMNADSPRVFAYRIMANPDRGMLGLVLMPTEKGLKVAGVTPGSAAEKAGVQAGDVIVAVDGKPVRSGKGAPAAGMLHGLKVGQRVALGLDRGGKARTIRVTAQRNDAADWPSTIFARNVTWHDMSGDKDIERAILDARRKIVLLHDQHPALFVGTPWWGLNLASLNKDLGGYFGTDKGALVLSGDSQRYPGLKAGDVITRVDGNTVDGPEDVMRALHEHKGKGDARITVRRHQRVHTVMMKVPSLDALLPPPPPMPPAPPGPVESRAAPAPPAPPPPPGGAM